ncbi:response regulator [Paucibacter sp. O1-1]|nr:response regulator [Paucibacter sp. O1-1]MDA3830853.1 response regulator [Paucibacter sp. O1-1]
MNGTIKHNGHVCPQHILLVEDEQDLAKLLILNLKALNYQVDHATTLKQAMQIIEHKKLDLILLDRMPPMVTALCCVSKYAKPVRKSR